MAQYKQTHNGIDINFELPGYYTANVAGKTLKADSARGVKRLINKTKTK